LVELGEPVREALRREVAEEVGLEVEVGDLVDVVDNIVRDPDGRVRYHYILLDFLAYPRGGELQVNQEVEDVGWFTPEEVEGLETTRTAKRLLRKIGFLPPEAGDKG
jgi:ADP-ribose pyrophosphatase YjhB (NUDIX family)